TWSRSRCRTGTATRTRCYSRTKCRTPRGARCSGGSGAPFSRESQTSAGLPAAGGPALVCDSRLNDYPYPVAMLYPLKFEPVFKPMLWGGDQLRSWLGRPESTDPTGEAWVLSDVDGSESVVANGPLAGRTLRQLLGRHREWLVGDAELSNGRFP